jgi:hypothetical protein
MYSENRAKALIKRKRGKENEKEIKKEMWEIVNDYRLSDFAGEDEQCEEDILY